ncbi:hypothetical protein Spock_184 [Bacillus phage Spock]|uniref:Uncharacterized protein n=1 Tax=Bacillus phage Spock TaxID=1406791 RepID=U5PXG1_9CAUD|nr:hypothetical protein Spock_184 [Bacillus phage Spock]AGY48584.1 hypothetical protein Spock_184 [Bacillus phage Spock]
METKTAYAVYALEYEEDKELVIVFEHENEANKYAEKYNKVDADKMIHYFVSKVPFKPREIW